jgi:3-deoxy-D-manno-octulosonic acid (KDO) 8-phosphate synthase
MKKVEVRGVTFSNDAPLVVIAGPCQLETYDHALEIGLAMKGQLRQGQPHLGLWQAWSGA